MRVLHVIPSYLPAWRYGGPVRAVHSLARAQVASGDTVEVFTTNVDGDRVLDVPTTRAVERDRVAIRYFAIGRPRRLARAPGLRRALHARIAEFDIVHLHSVFQWPTLVAARAAEHHRVPYVVAPRGMLVRELIENRGRWRKRAWLELFERRTLREAAAVLATSEVEAAEIRSLHLAETPIRVVPNGVPEPESEDRGTVSSAVEAASRLRPMILFLGRLSWKKGVDLLIRTLPALPTAHLVVAGNDDESLQPALLALARHCAVGDRVHFVGEVRGGAKQKLLAAATIFALPSLSENFGNAVLEALVAGVPAVLTPGVGLAPAAAAAGAALLCEREPGALGREIGALLADSARRERMSHAGRHLAAVEFTWSRVAAATRAVYLSATMPDAERELPTAEAS